MSVFVKGGYEKFTDQKISGYLMDIRYDGYSGRLPISFSRNFCIAKASLFVIPSPTLQQSALTAPFGLMTYLLGFDILAIMYTASDISTRLSQLASPYNTVPGAAVENGFTGIVYDTADVVVTVVVDVEVVCTGLIAEVTTGVFISLPSAVS